LFLQKYALFSILIIYKIQFSITVSGYLIHFSHTIIDT